MNKRSLALNPIKHQFYNEVKSVRILVHHNKLRLFIVRVLTNEDGRPQVTAALAQAGLESSNLIVGIDFTKSNEWTGLVPSASLIMIKLLKFPSMGSAC